MILNTPESYYNLYIACWDGEPKSRPIIDDVYDKLKNMLFNNNDDEGETQTGSSEFTTTEMEDNEGCEYSETTKFNFLDKEN